MKRILNFILFGNIYIAIAAVCLVQSTAIQLHFSDRLLPYYILVFFATLFIYNLQRIFYKEVKDKSMNSIRRKWIFENQTTIKMLTILGFAGVCVSFFFNDYKIVFYLSPLLLLSLAYFIPSVKLRKSAVFKLFTLAVVWTVTTAIVPILLNTNFPITKTEQLYFLLHLCTRFSFMLAICIPFDIRDVAIDSAENVSTLPIQYGENKTRWVAIFFTIIYSAFIVSEYFIRIISLPNFVALQLSMGATLLLVYFSNSKRSEYYFVAGIDGTMILQGILLFLLN